MRLRWFGLLIVGMGAVVTAWLVSTWAGERTKDEVWERIQSTGVMVVATDASYPPFEALDEAGNFFGFDIDLAEALGRRLGVRVEFENIGYDALLGTLIVKRDDVVISAYVPQLERQNEVSYTAPYFNAGPALVVRGDSGWRVEGEPQAWAEGKILVAEFGSYSDAITRQWARVQPHAEAVSAPSAPEAMLAVEEGRADAALVDATSAFDFLLGHPALALAGPPVEDEFYVMAVSRQSHKLLAALETALSEMKADGTLAELRVKWFGEAAREME